MDLLMQCCDANVKATFFKKRERYGLENWTKEVIYKERLQNLYVLTYPVIFACVCYTHFS